MNTEEIEKHYQKNRSEIDGRLEQFERLQEANDQRVFKELVFVILTSQSSAEKSWEATEKMDELGLLTSGGEEEIAELLENYDISYERNKANYIVSNRQDLSQPTLKDSSGDLKLKNKIDPENLEKTREWLVENLKGISWKGGSHFLRNIGYGNSFAIVSSRITSKLYELGRVEDPGQPSGKEEYLTIEEEMKKLSKETEIDVKALDLVLWSMETGKVFK